MSLRDRIRKHEGCVTVPYYDSEGIITVGIGRNLQAVPFSQDEIELMFSNDLRRARAGAKTFECYVDLDPMRQGVLTEMVFQMGVNGVSTFKNFLIAANNHDWATAAEEMLDSKWAKQTPERAKSLAKLFLRGVSER